MRMLRGGDRGAGRFRAWEPGRSGAGGSAIVVSRRPGHVTLRGELDIATAGEIRAALRRSSTGGSPLVVDTRQVTFVDCRGLGAILEDATPEAPIVLESPSPAVRRLLDLTGAEELVEIRPGHGPAAEGEG